MVNIQLHCLCQSVAIKHDSYNPSISCDQTRLGDSVNQLRSDMTRIISQSVAIKHDLEIHLHSVLYFPKCKYTIHPNHCFIEENTCILYMSIIYDKLLRFTSTYYRVYLVMLKQCDFQMVSLYYSS